MRNGPRAQRVLAFVFLALVAFGLLGATVRSLTGRSDAQAVSLPGGAAGELSGPAPWPANDDNGLRSRLAALGLPALPREGTVLHIHSHLDVFVDGKRVVVPAGIGIDPHLRFISPLHTHDTSGVIHVESPTVRTFTLGEFFGVWGVRLRDGCLGGYCGGRSRKLWVYAGGRPVADPATLPLAPHKEIVVAFGTRRQLPHPLPSTYAFPFGL
jgi:hypothetical protein